MSAFRTIARVLDRGKGGKLGIITTPQGRVYACTWAPDRTLTAVAVLDAWKFDRRAFKPFDESSGHYIGGGRS